MADNSTDPVTKLERRIKELNEKFSQTLLFISFALVVLATLKDKSNPSTLDHVASWWSISLFPILVGILPVKEFSEDNESWYRRVRCAKVVLLWIALILIGVGASYFFLAAVAGSFR